MNAFDDAMFYCAGVEPFDVQEIARPTPQPDGSNPALIGIDHDGYPWVPASEWYALDHRLREEIDRRRGLEARWAAAELAADRIKYCAITVVLVGVLIVAIWRLA